MNPVIHFELPAEDRKRMAQFYEKAFEWQTKMLGQKHGPHAPGPQPSEYAIIAQH